MARYVSLDDYSDAGGYKTFAKVARKGSLDLSNKRRRSLFGRRSALDRPASEERDRDLPAEHRAANATETFECVLLDARAERRSFNMDRVSTPKTAWLYTNI